MRVLGISWLGVHTDEFAVFEFPDGDKFEIFGAHATFPPQQFAGNRIIGGFLVDDIESARDELAVAPGVELVGEIHGDRGGYRWQHFVAPDGHVYELAYDPGRSVA